ILFGGFAMRQIFDSHQRDCWPAEIRTTVAVISAAFMMVLAACSDSSDRLLTAPTAGLRTSTGFVQSSGHGTGYSGHIKLCVDASSPAGTYGFKNSEWNSAHALPGYG